MPQTDQLVSIESILQAVSEGLHGRVVSEDLRIYSEKVHWSLVSSHAHKLESTEFQIRVKSVSWTTEYIQFKTSLQGQT